MDDNTEFPLLPSFEEMEKQKELELERLKWAIEYAPIHPTVWRHKHHGTPMKILIDHAKKSV